jgi:hypothetical protein
MKPILSFHQDLTFSLSLSLKTPNWIWLGSWDLLNCGIKEKSSKFIYKLFWEERRRGREVERNEKLKGRESSRLLFYSLFTTNLKLAESKPSLSV